MVAEGGFGALTVTGLAQRMDVAVGGLYRYYPSKEALIGALTGRAVAALAADFVRAHNGWRSHLPCEPGAAALAALWASGCWYLLLPSRRPALWLLINHALMPRKPLVNSGEVPAVKVPLAAMLAQLEGMFARGAAAGVLHPGDAQRRAAAYWSALHGSLLVGKLARLWPQRAHAFADPHVSHSVCETLLAGWGAHADNIAASRLWFGALATPAAPPPSS